MSRKTLASSQKRILNLKRFNPSLSLAAACLLASVPLAAQTVPDDSGGFEWRPVQIGAGGFVSGMSLSPTDEGAIYARTDVGNAYRLDGSTWTPIRVRTGSLASSSGIQSANDGGAPEPFGITSVVVDPSHSSNVYMAFPTTHSRDVLGTAAGNTGTTLSNNGVKVYYSTDGGYNFYPSDLDVPGTPNNQSGNIRYAGERIAVDPNNQNIVYYGSEGGGLWRSTNRGQNFSQVTGSNAPDPGSDAINVLFVGSATTSNPSGSGDPVTANVFAVTYNGDVFQSTDGGANWANISSGTSLSGRANFTTVDNQGQLYVSTFGNTYFRYTGGTWTEIPVGSIGNLVNVIADPTNDPNDATTARLYAISNCGDFYRSNDNGNSWTGFGKYSFANTQGWLPQTVGSDSNTCRTTGSLRFDANGTLWAAQGNEGPLSYTPPPRGQDTNDTPQWTIRSAGIQEFVASEITVPPDSGDTIIATVQDSTGFVITDPEDASTVKQIPLQNILISEGYGVAYVPNATNFVAVSSTNVYAGQASPDFSGFTENLGQDGWNRFAGTFSELQEPSTTVPAGNIALSARDGGNIQDGTDHIVITPTYDRVPIYSTDGGRSWNETNSFPRNGSSSTLAQDYKTLDNQGGHGNQLVADPFTPDRFYLKLLAVPNVDGTNLFVSNNGGIDWTGVDGGLPNGTYHGDLVTNRNLQDDLWFVDGYEGAGATTTTNGGVAHGLWHRVPPQDGNRDQFTFVNVPGFINAIHVALGAATSGGSANYTVYVYGRRSDDTGDFGVFRSTDGGQNWDRISFYPAGIYDWPTTMAASWDTPGKVYLGFTGNSFVYSRPKN